MSWRARAGPRGDRPILSSCAQILFGTMISLLASSTSFVVQPIAGATAVRAMVPSPAPAVFMQFGDATRDPEGNSVQEADTSETKTWDQLMAEAGQEEAKLSPEQQAQCVLPAESWKVEKMAMSNTDEDFEIQCASMDYATICVSIEPQMNTYQDYFFGLTADSDPKFKIDMSQSSPFEGRTARKGGEPTDVMIKCDPNGATGTFVAHLCYILPEEPTFSKFYKITCTSS